MDLRSALRSRTVLAAAGAGTVAVSAAVGAAAVARGPATPVAAAIPAVAAPGAATTVLVFVSGAVTHPGLYSLAVGARVADAIAAAGGLLPEADPGRLPDLAAAVHDGKQVNVPYRKGSTASGSSKVDVNTATVAELEGIPGMTAALAQAIVDARTAWGPFASLSDLRSSLGLDSATASLIGRHLVFTTLQP